VPRQPSRRTTRRRRWALLAAPVALFVVATALVLTRAPADAAGRIVPEHTLHQFGTVRMEDGLLAAAFPLTIDGGEVDAVDLTTT
jgi:hypothetical protein